VLPSRLRPTRGNEHGWEPDRLEPVAIAGGERFDRTAADRSNEGRHPPVERRIHVAHLAALGVEYLLKDRVSDLEELSASVRRVGDGGSVLDPSVVAQLVGQRRKGDEALDDLTERELDVLALMAEGRSNRAIGERLSFPSTPSRSMSRASLRPFRSLSRPTITGACWP
jgi:hypothetical protein